MLWELEAEVGWSIPGTAAGRGQVGTFSQSPEVLGSSELQLWGWVGRWMARAEPMAGSGRCAWERGCLHPRCWAPKVSGEHSPRRCAQVSDCGLTHPEHMPLGPLLPAMGQGPMQREREHFSSSSAPSTLQEDHAIEESQHEEKSGSREDRRS